MSSKKESDVSDFLQAASANQLEQKEIPWENIFACYRHCSKDGKIRTGESKIPWVGGFFCFFTIIVAANADATAAAVDGVITASRRHTWALRVDCWPAPSVCSVGTHGLTSVSIQWLPLQSELPDRFDGHI